MTCLTKLNADEPLTSLGRPTLLDFKLRWLGEAKTDDRPTGLSPVTVVKYLKAFKTFLEWCNGNPQIAYRYPDDFKAMYRFEKGSSQDIRPFENADLQAILHNANDRVRLYILLALNCGFTQREIGTLKHEHLMTNGEPCIYRQRQKAKHLNNFKTLYCLWPETWEHLQRNLATADEKANPAGWALLNTDGKPLVNFVETEDDEGETRYRKNDNIGCAFKRLADKIGVNSRFKDLRKTGATWLSNEYKDNGHRARLFLAHALLGQAKQYVKDDFAALTEGLKEWHKTLTSAGVFPLPPVLRRHAEG